VQLQSYEGEGDLNAFGLGEALIQYGGRLHGIGLYDDACSIKAEAVGVAQEYSEADPSAHSADLASFLESYGASLHARGAVHGRLFR